MIFHQTLHWAIGVCTPLWVSTIRSLYRSYSLFRCEKIGILPILCAFYLNLSKENCVHPQLLYIVQASWYIPRLRMQLKNHFLNFSNFNLCQKEGKNVRYVPNLCSTLYRRHRCRDPYHQLTWYLHIRYTFTPPSMGSFLPLLVTWY